jgi:cytochrome P450
MAAIASSDRRAIMVCPFHRELKPISADFHPFDPNQKANPYPIYARAHEEAPIFFSPDLNMWVVTEHKDIMEIARDPERFSSMGFTDRMSTLVPEALAILAQGHPMIPTLINNDAPAHTRIPALCNKAFTPRRVATMEPTIRELANSLVDEFAHEGRADIIARFAFHLPRIIIGDIVGVPREDIPLWGKWAISSRRSRSRSCRPTSRSRGPRGRWRCNATIRR